MGGGNQLYLGPQRPPGSSPTPQQGPSGQGPYFGGCPSPTQHRYVGGNGYNPWGDYTRGGYYNPNYSSSMPQDFQQNGWQGSGNNFNYQGMDGHQQSSGPDPGILVYDNIVTGDPRTVMIGQGNRAGGRVRGRISGNRIIRS